MEGDEATVETTVSADPDPEKNEVASILDVRQIAGSLLRKQVGKRPLLLLVAGFVLLVAVHRALASRGLLSFMSSTWQRADRLLGKGQERGDWGLCSLEHFEQELSPSLMEGKKSLAALASKVRAHDDDKAVWPYQRALAWALSNNTKGSLVGMTISLRNTKPLNRTIIEGHLPQELRVTSIVGYFRWNLVVNAEDVETKKEFSVSIPVISDSDAYSFIEDGIEKYVEVAAEQEKKAMLQACGNIPAKLAASQKGIALPYYTGQILGLDNIHQAGGYKVLSSVAVMEKVVGSLGSAFSVGTVDENALNYIAHRLLQIVLNFERSGVGHTQLAWESLWLREDGSFLLGNFGSCAPVGEQKARLSGRLSLNLEPTVMTRYAESDKLIIDDQANLWSLGILLFQLYGGVEHPYEQLGGAEWSDQPEKLAQRLLKEGIRSEFLVPQLQQKQFPLRWGGLILRLLEPDRANRITGSQIMTQFADLIKPQSVANE
ncbi:hypothetical protein EMWEY_00023550 [Eimeria maxima]|uniref:Protein kinase domain-containing protein n=1 Tax=Eimeria maxima TaxID=5804 RepID=U6M5Z0_EIMMA|nr:hypothetical protein EMWEY_00023550 [Eimeria maxima]CDJ59622.1 hypothetical protein EMWEY_00023550 [Eimeria maxima]